MLRNSIKERKENSCFYFFKIFQFFVPTQETPTQIKQIIFLGGGLTSLTESHQDFLLLLLLLKLFAIFKLIIIQLRG